MTNLSKIFVIGGAPSFAGRTGGSAEMVNVGPHVSRPVSFRLMEATQLGAKTTGFAATGPFCFPANQVLVRANGDTP